MAIRRRELLVGGGMAALAAACAKEGGAGATSPAGAAGETREDVLARAIDAAKKAGATYADARIVRRRWENLGTREDHVVEIAADESYGVGVRVIAGGAWGFAATSRVDGASAEDAAARAVALARANARGNERPVVLAPVQAVRASWSTPMTKDPFAVPLDAKAEYLLAIWREARAEVGIKYGSGHVELLSEEKIFASTDGSLITQSITRVSPSFTATAVDPASGEFESVRDLTPPMQGGWEYVENARIRENARATAQEAVKKLAAPAVEPGVKDLVLAPSNLWLTIHESAGHATELDRALGYEANLAGTSFATTEKRGKLRFGSPRVSIYADKTTPGGLATCGFDDDGVPTGRWDLIKDGIFVGYQTTREQAGWIGEKASRATAYAQDYRSIPFQRMPNVCLTPSDTEATLDDLVAGVDDGVVAMGDGSWSIDHQRYNFQFGAQRAYAVKGGKIAGPVRDFAYQSNSIAFWNSCDGLGGKKSWELHGALHDGKGEPGQSNAVSHGCPPARFRKVNVISTRAVKKGGA